MPNSNAWGGTNYTYGLTRPLYNYLDNGGFAVNQRKPATNTALTGSGSLQLAYFADRWLMVLPAGSGTFTATQADLSNTAAQYILNTNNVEIDGYFSLTGSVSGLPTNTRIEQSLPVSVLKTLSGRQVTMSAFIYAPAVASQSVTFQLAQSFGTGGSPSPSISYSTTVTIAALTTWQLVTFPVFLGSTNGKTFGTNGDSQLIARIYPDVTKAFNMLVTQVQLQEGQFYTGFHKKPLTEEEANCGRYYQKTFARATLPSNNITTGRVLFGLPALVGNRFYTYILPTAMAKAPSLVFYNPAATGAGLAHNYTRNNASASITASANSTNREVEVTIGDGVGWAISDLAGFQAEFKADFNDPA